MHVAAVIFDMDGLILDTERPVQICCQEAAAELHFDLDAEFYVEALVGRGWDDCYRALSLRFGPRFDVDEFRRRFQTKWDSHLRSSGIAVKPGFHELFGFLRSHAVRTALATSTYADDARASLAAAQLAATFDVMVTGDQVARGKPDPEIYLTAAARLRVAPESCVALEDSSPGVLAATAAGMMTFLIPEEGRSPSVEAVRAAYQVLTSLHDTRQLLAGAGPFDVRGLRVGMAGEVEQ